MAPVVSLICCCLALIPLSRAMAEPIALTLNEAIRLAQDNNPEVRALATDVGAATARLGGAALLLQSNPTMAVEAGSRHQRSLGGGVEYSIQVLQQVEVAGQRGIRIDAASAALDATHARLQALRVDVTAQVRESFGRVVAADQRVRLSAEALAIAQQGVDAVDERFRAGAIPLLELNTARVELGRATRARADAQRRHSEAVASLRLLLGLDPSATFTAQSELRTDTPLENTAELLAQALANRGEIAEARRALDSAKAEASLAARAWIPSPRIGASYRYEQDTDTNIVLGVVQFELPAFNRNGAARGVTAARVDQLAVALTATDRRIQQEVLTARDRVEAARAAADGYAGDVVRAMQQNMELVTESYRAGKIEFLELVVIRRQAVEARGEYIDVLEELNAAEAQLGRALGRSE